MPTLMASAPAEMRARWPHVQYTKGGPDNASSLLLYHIYEVAFSFFDESYAATLTVVLLAALAIISVGQFLLLDKRVHYR